jgi:hypothetical protein
MVLEVRILKCNETIKEVTVPRWLSVAGFCTCSLNRLAVDFRQEINCYKTSQSSLGHTTKNHRAVINSGGKRPSVKI